MLTLLATGLIEKTIDAKTFPDWDAKKAFVQNWIESINRSSQKEAAIKSSFLTMLFKDILGYSPYDSQKEFYLKEENISEAGSADFGLGYCNISKATQVSWKIKRA